MYTLYSMQRSGNSYKVRLALAQLGIPFRLVEIDILKGESRTPEFLAKNPHGQVPLLEAAPGRYLAESNAILWHLVNRTPLRPEHRIDRAEALQWMFFEQHRYFVADRYTVADIALYAYTHLAHACDFDLASFPGIRAWLERVKAQPGHIAMDWQPANVVAAE